MAIKRRVDRRLRRSDFGGDARPSASTEGIFGEPAGGRGVRRAAKKPSRQGVDHRQTNAVVCVISTGSGLKDIDACRDKPWRSRSALLNPNLELLDRQLHGKNDKDVHDDHDSVRPHLRRNELARETIDKAIRSKAL
ncbi:MAG: hypothetical protein MZU97_20725 [Bacillus subtilis]|nr:hypothetical protein [Bacillus subtilis]